MKKTLLTAAVLAFFFADCGIVVLHIPVIDHRHQSAQSIELACTGKWILPPLPTAGFFLLGMPFQADIAKVTRWRPPTSRRDAGGQAGR